MAHQLPRLCDGEDYDRSDRKTNQCNYIAGKTYQDTDDPENGCEKQVKGNKEAEEPPDGGHAAVDPQAREVVVGQQQLLVVCVERGVGLA